MLKRMQSYEEILRCRNKYISTASNLQEVLFDMISKNEFTEDQLRKLLPSIDELNEVLNKDLRSF